MPLHVTVVTQTGKLFEELAADSVAVPGSEGQMVILPHHAALISTLAFGELRIRKGGAEEDFIVYGGIIEVRPDRVIVLADTAESSFDLDEAKAHEARERAQELMRHGLPAEEENRVLQELRRAEAQELTAHKVRSRPPVMRIQSIDAEGNDLNKNSK